MMKNIVLVCIGIVVGIFIGTSLINKQIRKEIQSEKRYKEMQSEIDALELCSEKVSASYFSSIQEDADEAIRKDTLILKVIKDLDNLSKKDLIKRLISITCPEIEE